MSRPLEGSVRRRGKYFLGSVPKLDGGRLECQFPTEDAAWKWIAKQIKRLNGGLAPVKPVRAKPVRAIPVRGNMTAQQEPGRLKFCNVAKEWWHERYTALHAGQLERAEAVERDLELHIYPALHSLFAMNGTDGRQLVINWIRALAGFDPAYPNSPFTKRAKGYERSTVEGWLLIVNKVVKYARARGYDIPDYTEGVSALDRVGKQRTATHVIDLTETLRIASHLHVIHQLALWLMRLGGFRISEAYGLHVMDFVIENGRGYLRFHEQGGRRFVRRDEQGRRATRSYKPTGKTDAATRVVPIPGLLTEMIVAIIEVFHLVEGVADPEARLIPPIIALGGGQQGFRSALSQAAAAEGFDDDVDELLEALTPQDLRKNFATDIGWREGLTPVQCKRIMGHRAGGDVFNLVYRQDGRLQDHLAPVARELERMLVAEDITTLMMPTSHRPLYGKAIYPRECRSAIDATLIEIGWQVLTPMGEIGTAEAADILGMAESATRRLFPELIAGHKDNKGNWRTTEDDVIAFRERLKGHRLLTDIADEAGVSYHQAYTALGRLGISTGTDEHSRQKLISSADANRIIDEFRRIDDLRTRSMTVAEAASALGTRHSSITAWVKNKRLIQDAETDASGKRYVTRASVNAELDNRRRPRRTSVAIDEFRAMTGATAAELDVLIKRKILIRTGRGHLTRASIEAWMTGFRPDLLNRLG